MLPKIIRTGIHRYEGTGVRKTEMATQYRKAYVPVTLDVDKEGAILPRLIWWDNGVIFQIDQCALPGFVDSKNEEKTERNAGYLVVSHSGGGMLRQGTREGIRRTPANRGMRAHRIVKGLDISEDVCHGMCP